jgi:hypothetical protein
LVLFIAHCLAEVIPTEDEGKKTESDFLTQTGKTFCQGSSKNFQRFLSAIGSRTDITPMSLVGFWFSTNVIKHI